MWWGNPFSRLFSKKSKLRISLSGSIVQKLIQFVFVVCLVEGYRKILKLGWRLMTFFSYKAFTKNQKNVELVSLPHFLHDF